MAGETGLGLDIKVLLKTPRSVLTGEEDERIRDPRLNSLRSFSAKNLTGQAGIRGQEGQKTEYRKEEIGIRKGKENTE